jgi:hypothetical protein
VSYPAYRLLKGAKEGGVADERNKEQVYDSEIEPLMAQIIRVCQERGIAMVASFAIPTPEDADLNCTSFLPDGDGNPHPLTGDVQRWLRGPRAFAFTITGAKP